MGDLFPGLPDELAMECLIRMHFESFPNAVLTCKKWKHEIRSPLYLRRRIEGGHCHPIVVMTQEDYGFDIEDPDRKTGIIRLVICGLKTGNWKELPPIPGYVNGFPFDCKLAVVGLNLVVIGRSHPPWVEDEASNEVYIYCFISNTWRRGAEMLDARLCRGFRGCVSDSDQVVYVVGGREKNKIMTSALAYTVAEDKWVRLPDLETDVVSRGGFVDAAFLSGKLHVFGDFYKKADYIKEFNLCAQSFDPTTSTWSPVCKIPLGHWQHAKPAGRRTIWNLLYMRGRCGGFA